jgi:hypothetical protein
VTQPSAKSAKSAVPLLGVITNNQQNRTICPELISRITGDY